MANLVIACHSCNQRKADQSIEAFLEDRSEVLARIQTQLRVPLRDATAVNVIRWALHERLNALALPLETGTGGLTSWNREIRSLPKAHWIDAACCGSSTPARLRLQAVHPWLIKATGRQTRLMVNVDEHGFPVGHPKGPSRVRGFRTGDLVKAVCPPRLKTRETHVGQVLVRTRGSFDIQTKHRRIKDVSARYCKLLQAGDGYWYTRDVALLQA